MQKLKLLVSLSVLQYLRKKQLLQLLLGGADRAKTYVFVKMSHTNKMRKESNGLPHSPRASPQLKLNCESGLTLYPRRSFILLFCFCFIYSLI